VNALAATTLLARLSLKRLLRGKAIWLGALLLTLPSVVALTAASGIQHWRRPFEVAVLLLSVVPPLYLATAVSDEVDDKTFTYLWSRPIARWTVLSGKLAGLLPVLIVAMAIAVALPYFLLFGASAGEHLHVLGRGIAGITVGAIATGMVSIGLGTLVPKYPLPIVISYLLLFDAAVGEIPFAINRLTISHNVREIAGIPADTDQIAAMLGLDASADPLVSALWALGIGAVWLAIGLWRVSVAEFATHK